ncbi:hypothetical protein RvY_16224-2 [Ramazzottius varieornatus]|uniref:Uncharacterized protein n=1 Tax=Ramazzottius varieornatus TaxID=947166 RepID=A0A1D1W5E2_RAMVA|nr:hypothetical protein RvY_16224-2 [Ramazzottius varieornatus]
MCLGCAGSGGDAAYGLEIRDKDQAWFEEQGAPAKNHNGPAPIASISIIFGSLLGVAIVAGVIAFSCIFHKNYKKKRFLNQHAGATRASPSHTIIGFLAHRTQQNPGHAHPTTAGAPPGPPKILIDVPSSTTEPPPPMPPELKPTPSTHKLHPTLPIRHVPISRRHS